MTTQQPQKAREIAEIMLYSMQRLDKETISRITRLKEVFPSDKHAELSKDLLLLLRTAEKLGLERERHRRD